MKTNESHSKVIGSARSEIRQFFTLVKMLLSDTLKLSFDTKASRKASIIRIVSAVLVFAVLTALGVLFYSLSSLFGIFSLLSFVPEAVPSFLSIVILAFALLNSVASLVKTLYFSPDNRLMITYPCRGSSVFLARLFVFFIKEVVRLLLSLTPILLSYLVFSHFPWYSYLWLLVSLLLVSAFLVLFSALLSIPGYYVRLFFKRNSLVAFSVYALLFGFFIFAVTWIISLIPNKIDIFTNFGPYFSAIQSAMKAYRDQAWLAYLLTRMMIGSFDGFTVTPFTNQTLLLFFIILGITLTLFLFARFVTNRLYLHLASESFEYESVGALHEARIKKRSYWLSQLQKEVTLFIKNPDTFASLFGTFVFLPIAMALINKIFGAMDTTVLGNMYISSVNLLLILLVALASNESVAHLYSEEGNAFALNHIYPHQPYYLLISKLILPSLLGVASITASGIYYGQINSFKLNSDGLPWVSGNMVTYFIIALCSIYLGHLLFAAGLDFCATKSEFMSQTSATENQRNVVISAFALAIFLAFLFYLFLKDGIEGAYWKIMIVGLVYLALNILLFYRKAKYLYSQGGTR
jgi:hypothetical protein